MQFLWDGPDELNVCLNMEETMLVQQSNDAKLACHAQIVNHMYEREREGYYMIFVYDNNLNLVWESVTSIDFGETL